MIDEKKLIAEIREKIYPERYGERCNPLDVIYGILQVINEQPKVGEWIPCSERLPEDELDAEITYRGGMRGVGFYMGGYWRSTATGMAIDVIAWKEPSEPWEGGNDD